MDDKCLMENLLLVEKGVCDLYMHGTIESGTLGFQQGPGRQPVHAGRYL